MKHRKIENRSSNFFILWGYKIYFPGLLPIVHFISEADLGDFRLVVTESGFAARLERSSFLRNEVEQIKREWKAEKAAQKK